MAFTEVSWTNGDYLTETKLDQMVASDVHVRSETEFKVLVSGGAGRVVASSLGTLFSVKIDAVTLDSWSTDGAKTVLDEDISGYSDGPHTLTFTVGSVDNTFVYRFVKSVDMDRLSVWVTFSGDEINAGSRYLAAISSVTVIGHRTSESWTI